MLKYCQQVKADITSDNVSLRASDFQTAQFILMQG